MNRAGKFALASSFALFGLIWLIPACRWMMEIPHFQPDISDEVIGLGMEALPGKWTTADFQRDNPEASWLAATFYLDEPSYHVLRSEETVMSEKRNEERMLEMAQGLPDAKDKVGAQFAFLRHSLSGLQYDYKTKTPEPLSNTWLEIERKADSIATELTHSQPENAFPWLFRAAFAQHQKNSRSNDFLHAAAGCSEFNNHFTAEYDEAMGLLARTEAFVSQTQRTSVWIQANDGYGGFIRGVKYGTKDVPFNSPVRRHWARIGDLIIRKGEGLLAIFLGRQILQISSQPPKRSQSTIAERSETTEKKKANVLAFAATYPNSISATGLRIATSDPSFWSYDGAGIATQFQMIIALMFAWIAAYVAFIMFLLSVLTGRFCSNRAILLARGVGLLLGLGTTVASFVQWGEAPYVRGYYDFGIALTFVAGFLGAASFYPKLGVWPRRAVSLVAAGIALTATFLVPPLTPMVSGVIFAWPGSFLPWLGKRKWGGFALLFVIVTIGSAFLAQAPNPVELLYTTLLGLSAFLAITVLMKVGPRYRNLFAYSTAFATVVFAGIAVYLVRSDASIPDPKEETIRNANLIRQRAKGE